MLSRLDGSASGEDRARAGKLIRRARDLVKEAGEECARAELHFIAALETQPGFPLARRAFADFAYRQFEVAESAGYHVSMAHYYQLAKAFDDGRLASLLAGKGELDLRVTAGAPWTLWLYEETDERYLTAGSMVAHGDGSAQLELKAGSYVLMVRAPHGEFRFPVLIGRASVHLLEARVPEPGLVPAGMVYVPGGQFLFRPDADGRRTERARLQDFAIGRFPVTLRDYCVFLDALDETERARRTPMLQVPGHDARPMVERVGRGWHVSARILEGAARQRVDRDRDMEIPVFGITWFDAVAYTDWYSHARRPFRLPTDLEWEKAARGVDGRVFPMGPVLDPSFAKRRESRPEGGWPEPIGAFPLDESPYGVRDLAGGVYNFTSSSTDGRAISLRDESSPTIGELPVAFCGGSFHASAALPLVRFYVPARYRAVNVGFRLALSLDVGSDNYSDRPDA